MSEVEALPTRTRSRCRVAFVGFTRVSRQTLYTIKVFSQEGSEWEVRKNDGEFRGLHRRLRKSNPWASLPRLPTRSWLFASDPAVIAMQQLALWRYMEQVLMLGCPPEVAQFLAPPAKHQYPSGELKRSLVDDLDAFDEASDERSGCSGQEQLGMPQRVDVLDFAVIDGLLVFTFRVADDEGHVWCVERQYRELWQLHDFLKEQLAERCPRLPGPKALEGRAWACVGKQRGLYRYFRKLLQLEYPPSAFYTFLAPNGSKTRWLPETCPPSSEGELTWGGSQHTNRNSAPKSPSSYQRQHEAVAQDIAPQESEYSEQSDGEQRRELP